MKKQIVHIANQLKLGEITTKEAKEELLSLFGVSGSSFCEQRELLKAFLTWFDADLSCLKDHNGLIDDYFNSL